jgi:hypothetical protein
MATRDDANRRGFMKMLAASPLLAQIAAQGLYEKSAAAIGLDPRETSTPVLASRPSSTVAVPGPI